MTRLSALQIIADFITTVPPLNHNRKSYRDPCNQGCKACVFLAKRKVALDAVLKLQSRKDQNFGKTHDS